jgi:hypothetical protein
MKAGSFSFYCISAIYHKLARRFATQFFLTPFSLSFSGLAERLPLVVERSSSFPKNPAENQLKNRCCFLVSFKLRYHRTTQKNLRATFGQLSNIKPITKQTLRRYNP